MMPWLILLLAAAVYGLATAHREPGEPPSNFAYMFGIMSVVVTVVLLGEMRTRISQITIDGNRLVARNYCGIGPRREFDLSRIDGYMIAMQRVMVKSTEQQYEHLYLMSGKRKLLKIADTYYLNYPELKEAIASRVQHTGDATFRLADDWWDYILPLPKVRSGNSNRGTA